METEKSEHQLLIDARDSKIVLLEESPAGFTEDYHKVIRDTLKNEELTTFKQFEEAITAQFDNRYRHTRSFDLKRVDQPRQKMPEYEEDRSFWTKFGVVQLGELVIVCVDHYNFYDG